MSYSLAAVLHDARRASVTGVGRQCQFVCNRQDRRGGARDDSVGRRLAAGITSKRDSVWSGSEAFGGSRSRVSFCGGSDTLSQ
jgi:hypothetical protein